MMIDLVPIYHALICPSVFFQSSLLCQDRQGHDSVCVCVCFVGYGTMAPWNAKDEHYGLLFTLAPDR